VPFDPGLPTSATGGYLPPTTPHPTGDLAFARVINNIVVGITGIAPGLVRPRWQEVPPPIPLISTDWVAIGVTDIAPERGLPYERHYDDYSTERLEEELTVLATFYGPNAEKNARTLRDGLTIPQNLEEAKATAQLNLIDTGPIRTLPELIDNRWYRRADIEIHFRRHVERDYNIRSIVEAPGHIQGDAQGLARTNDFTVTEDV
jgi:hypothetical protein